MKAAQFRYIHTNLDISVNVYFDLKAFEFIKPPLNAEEEEHLIHQISDSLAASMSKESTEKNFYIKRAIKHTATHHLKIFCTDGFLMDTALVVPIIEQAFANERIKIIEVEQLPTRLKFSNEILKIMSDRLPLFEEEVRKDIAEGKITVAKEEAAKPEKQPIGLREYAPDTTLDIFGEIGNIKKEIREIAENNQRLLIILMKQANETRQRTYENIMKETKIGLVEEENKKKLEAFAKYTISQLGGGDIEKNKALVNNKIQEITAIPNKFDHDIETITLSITKQTDQLLTFKQHLITALYESAKQYYQDELSKQMLNITPNNKKIMINEFNKKFAGFATLSESGKLASNKEAQENLGHLSLNDLQKMISNEDKDNPGVLQKCNTSWIDESPELQIVMKNINRLNTILTSLFKATSSYEQHAPIDMVQMTRVPFPRSFQFSFTPQALDHINSVDTFCKTQKATISALLKEYKKTMQIDDIQDKTQRAIMEIEKQTEMMKRPVMDYKELLRRKEMSKTIFSSANIAYGQTVKLITETKKWQELINVGIGLNFKKLKKKINRLSLDLQTQTEGNTHAIKKITASKAEIDTIVDNVMTPSEKKLNIDEIDEKIRSMRKNHQTIIETNKSIENENDKLAFYTQAIRLKERMITFTTKYNMQKQHSEAKSLILQFIKNQTRDMASMEDIKKHMVDLYTQIDTAVVNIEKSHQEATELQDQLFRELNSGPDFSSELLNTKLRPLAAKLDRVDLSKKLIIDNLAYLKKLSLSLVKE